MRTTVPPVKPRSYGTPPRAMRSAPSLGTTSGSAPRSAFSYVRIGRQPSSTTPSGDEAWVHAGPVQVRPPDRARTWAGPVDVVGVDRHGIGPLGGDEAVVHARSIAVRPSDPVEIGP